jgi:hypothetical protein
MNRKRIVLLCVGVIIVALAILVSPTWALLVAFMSWAILREVFFF